MKPITPIEKHHGRYLPWAAGSAAFIGLAGTLWALSEVLENDSDGDGWTDTEEIVAGTNPADETDPWDSDGDGIADYLEFADGTDPLNPNDPPRIRKSPLAYSVAVAGDDAKCLLLLSRYASQETGAFEVLLVKNWSFEETTGEVEIPLVQKKEGSNEVVATTMRYSHLLKKSSDYSTLGIATPMNTILGQGNISGPTNFNFH